VVGAGWAPFCKPPPVLWPTLFALQVPNKGVITPKVVHSCLIFLMVLNGPWYAPMWVEWAMGSIALPQAGMSNPCAVTVCRIFVPEGWAPRFSEEATFPPTVSGYSLGPWLGPLPTRWYLPWGITCLGSQSPALPSIPRTLLAPLTGPSQCTLVLAFP